MTRVMIIADLSEKKYFATPRGLELAHRLGHSAEVIAFTHAPLKSLNLNREEQASARERLLEQRREEVQQRIERYRREDQKIKLKVVWEKDIASWINRHCNARDYSAVVKTVHTSGGMLYTPTDWQLLRECPAPVLLVSDKKWHKTKPVLAALDLSTRVRSKQALNHRIIDAAKTLAQALDADLNLIAAIEIPTLLADLDLVDPHSYVADAKAAIQPRIKALAQAHDLPESSFRVKRGPTDKVVTSEAAKIRAQLVVLGTRGRKGVSARLLGNTAEHVLEHIRTDIYAVKP